MSIVDVIVPNVPTAEEVDSFKGIPLGGTTGQALLKTSGTDYDTHWGTVSGGGGSLTPIHQADSTTWSISSAGDASGILSYDITKYGQLVVANIFIGVDEGSVGNGNDDIIFTLPSDLIPINFSPQVYVQPLVVVGSSENYPLAVTIARTADFGDNGIFIQFYGSGNPLSFQLTYQFTISWFVAP